MWVYFKKQGKLVNFDPSISIDVKDQKWVVATRVLDTKYDVITFKDKDSVDMFVSQFEHALKYKEPILTFDEDKPKFTMKLSGNDDEDKNEPQAEVGLE